MEVGFENTRWSHPPLEGLRELEFRLRARDLLNLDPCNPTNPPKNFETIQFLAISAAKTELIDFREWSQGGPLYGLYYDSPSWCFGGTKVCKNQDILETCQCLESRSLKQILAPNEKPFQPSGSRRAFRFSHPEIRQAQQIERICDIVTLKCEVALAQLRTTESAVQSIRTFFCPLSRHSLHNRTSREDKKE